MSRILVVDDDRPLLRALHITLTARGYDVHSAPDGRTALDVAAHHPPDLAIVDLGLPDMDGIAVIGALRGWSAAPIIVLSARHAEPAKINALDAGADDYVTKPFGMGELLARVRAETDHETLTTLYSINVHQLKILETQDQILKALDKQAGLTGEGSHA